METLAITSMRGSRDSKNLKERYWEESRQLKVFSIISRICLKVKMPVPSETLVSQLQQVPSLDKGGPADFSQLQL
jgi:hypothetical protein